MKKMIMLAMTALCGLSAWAVDYEVVPRPNQIELQKGDPFVLADGVQILAPADLQREAQFLQEYIREATGLSLPIASQKQKKTTYIELSVSPKVAEAEGYTLTVGKKGVTIAGGSAAGVFYGIQTLRKSLEFRVESGQLIVDSYDYQSSADMKGVQGNPNYQLSTVNSTLPPVVVSDAPRFGYRGMHLDCCRHFWSVDFIKKFIDLLALHNMNTFHWHLTDDQGWRIEIKSWPKLTSVGANRTGTIIGHNSDLDDETPVGGYYTQDEAREIVAYAAERHINVIPEIELPGHTLAALASYPELGCTGGPYKVGHYWGIYRDVLCVGNEQVYKFVADVLSEIADVFPSEVIHIGGDETPTARWEQCPKCQALGLPKEKIQGYFTQRVFDILTARHRRALGWDEILDGAPQDAMIMCWRGTEPGARAAETGHDVVMAPTTYCYFDYQQTDKEYFEPSRCGGNIPVEKVYSLDPAPDSLSAEAKAHILGVQANLWSEYLVTEGLVEYQALPRMSALAEVQWTQPGRKDFEAFRSRMTRLLPVLDRRGYHYAKHLWPELQMENRWEF